ncbi:hypothetical protein HZA56_16310 [Candidatus Poribacteria bacterium]|nr:hypothetical protein [Candidatus Poribacteria bacterium]
MIRRDEQKKVQESSRKDFSRDKSRLDYKVEASANKLPDSRIRDQKYLSAETQRGREEAKLEEEKLRRPDEELAEAASMAQEVLMRQGKRDFFGIELR